MSRPKSATAVLTGIAGLCGFALSLAALIGSGWPIHLKALAVMAVTAAAMIAVDSLYFRTYRHASTGLAPTRQRPLEHERILRKMVGFIATLAVLAAVYWVVPEYRRDFYMPYWAALYVIVPTMLVAAPFYIAFVDRRQVEPEDTYAEIGTFIFNGTLPQKSEELRHHVLGWIVKGFFLPLMFVYFCNLLGTVLAMLERPQPLDFMRFHVWATETLFMIDVLIAAIGYILTLRILDNQVRSVEPTVLGWLVCVACYAPLNNATGSYLSYEAGGDWTTALDAWPAVKIAWGVAILLCFTVYAWATVSFGLRFSNLTHRGIITNGPYRWTKHPAYVAKNISWWLVSVPFLTAASPGEALRHSLILLGFSAVYVMRAITEERHLSRDPEYVAYRLFIAEHGAIARIRRLWAEALAPRSV